jgi:hypothetical protein
MRILPVLAFVVGCVAPPPTSSGPRDTAADGGTPITFSAIGFNVESGGADPQVVADEVVTGLTGASVVGFAEVEDDDAAALLVGALPADGGADWQYVLGTTGWDDRLVLAWDDARFALDSSEELADINVGGTVRAPLVGHLRERASDQALLFVVNHLWRSDAASRHEQAGLLNDWGRAQDGPVVMVGDYNFDWDVETGEHDAGYDALVADGVFRWVEPATLVKTECSPYYDSVLDFVFVGGAALAWDATSEILRADEDYCSNGHTATWSDHRPVEATFSF